MVALDEQLVPRRGADRWHHALMDLGATICVARTPRCEACPIAQDCRSRGRVVRAAPRRQAPFATSDRRVRGRIVSVLAQGGAVPMGTLERAIDDRRARTIVGLLEREGLIERDGELVRLPR
jgi:A/G-specific adenine glycosylase